MSGSGQSPASAPLVLVVDDEPQIRAFLHLTLEDAGFAVQSAEDGVAALALLQSQQPAVVITDLMMPRMNGWELCRRLRASAETAAIQLVVISALQASPAPGDAFLRKPFELETLLAVLQRLAPAARSQGDGARRPARPVSRPSATAP